MALGGKEGLMSIQQVYGGCLHLLGADVACRVAFKGQQRGAGIPVKGGCVGVLRGKMVGAF